MQLHFHLKPNITHFPFYVLCAYAQVTKATFKTRNVMHRRLAETLGPLLCWCASSLPYFVFATPGCGSFLILLFISLGNCEFSSTSRPSDLGDADYL
jgi:hypothetical protein